METNTYLTKHDVLNETSLWRGAAATWSPRVMILSPCWAMERERFWESKSPRIEMGFPLDSCNALFQGDTDIHTWLTFLFSIINKIWILRLWLENISSYPFPSPPPKKNLRMSPRALNERCRSWWVSTAHLEQLLVLGSLPKTLWWFGLVHFQCHPTE